MNYYSYTQDSEYLNIRNENKCYDRHQADYDYNGSIDADGDSADYYRPIRMTKVG